MPNWCANRLEVYGKSTDVKKFIEDVQSKEDEDLLLDFEVFRKHIPDGPLFPSLTGRHRQDPDDPMTREITASKVVYEFSSSWGPPYPDTMCAMLAMFPSLIFCLYYAEKGQGFIGFQQKSKQKSSSWHKEDVHPSKSDSDDDDSDIDDSNKASKRGKKDFSDGVDWEIFRPLWNNSG